MRLRPTAAELFPEIAGLELTPRATGKPSIELPTAGMQSIVCAATTRVDFMVFLIRKSGLTPQIVPYSKDAARQTIQETLFGLPETLARQYIAVEHLLALDVLEMHYTDLHGPSSGWSGW